MKPGNLIRREIITQAALEDDVAKLFSGADLTTDDGVEHAYDNLMEKDANWDYELEFREGQFETKIAADFSRHYESKSVARKMADGTWVGWTYWYGGGKHGEPEAIGWMDQAYLLSCVEEQKTVTVRTFSKAE